MARTIADRNRLVTPPALTSVLETYFSFFEWITVLNCAVDSFDKRRWVDEQISNILKQLFRVVDMTDG